MAGTRRNVPLMEVSPKYRCPKVEVPLSLSFNITLKDNFTHQNTPHWHLCSDPKLPVPQYWNDYIWQVSTHFLCTEN